MEVPEASGHALDGVVVSIELVVSEELSAATLSSWDVRTGPEVVHLIARGAVGHLPTREHQPDRAAPSIRKGMDLRGAPAPRAADPLCHLPPFSRWPSDDWRRPNCR